MRRGDSSRWEPRRRVQSGGGGAVPRDILDSILMVNSGTRPPATPTGYAHRPPATPTGHAHRPRPPATPIGHAHRHAHRHAPRRDTFRGFHQLLFIPQASAAG
ncbi:hypothetical protein EYF80_048813 [Liparis tanakae]|uniref:Uncharacterized protein n=1 Tax=Liparis tanakae TaxID=230148 RepID=A0A4Z2FIH5_9TELE|nr:hypothetical protein EYF80_048813 [Liparis tanakae]